MTVPDHIFCSLVIRTENGSSGPIHMSGSRENVWTQSAHLCSVPEDLTTGGRCAVASQASLNDVGPVGALPNQLASVRTDDQTAAVLEDDNCSQETQ